MIFLALYRCRKSLQVFMEAWVAAREKRINEALQR
jgi:hypothetical protein